MRVAVVAAAFALTLVSCIPADSSDSTTPLLEPPELGRPDTTNGLDGSTRDPTSELIQLYEGVLPDGTDYTISIRQDREESVTLDYAPVLYQPTGVVLIARMARIANPPAPGTPERFDQGVYRAYAGDWIVEMVLDQSVVDDIGPGVADVVEASIGVEVIDGFPVLTVGEPFGWDPDGNSPEVRYESFVVRPGCGIQAVLCSDNNVVQVIPAQSLYPGTPALFGDVISVDSESSRPVANINFFDPGPLSPRTGADVIWTGTEVIVWGGSEADDTYLVDGARFDLETGVWRLLPPLPVSGEQVTRSIWVDGRLVVVSGEQTWAWTPEAPTTWEVVTPSALVPARLPGFLQTIGQRIYAWNALGVFYLDVAAEQPEWLGLPEPPIAAASVQADGRQASAMLTDGDSVYLAARLDTGCGPRRIVRWDGESWRTLPPASLETTDRPDCSFADQMATTPVGLVIWYTMDHLTLIYDAGTNAWAEIDRIPLPGSEDPSGAVSIGDDYFLVPQAGSAAVFRYASQDWLLVEFPGSGSETTMVWTGTEILSWQKAPFGVAFRWSPDGVTLVNSATTR